MAGARGRASHGRIAVRSPTEAHCPFQGKREEGGESSAWLARVGAPRTAESPCVPVCEYIAVLVEKREEGGESSAWLARVSAPRTAESPCNP